MQSISPDSKRSFSTNPLSRLTRFATNFMGDRILGIDTRGTVSGNRPGAVYYATVDYSATFEALKHLDLRVSDTFVDVGSGKGRVLCLAARKLVRRVIGVEYSAELSDIAMRNANQMRGRKSPVEIFVMPAEEFDYSSATAFYFFNPFEAHVLDAVLSKIQADCRGNSIRLLFVMESEKQRAIFNLHHWLTCQRRWVGSGGHPTALYRSL